MSTRDRERLGHHYDRNYVITQHWLGQWEGSCSECGEMTQGTLAAVFSLLWKHRKCEGAQR